MIYWPADPVCISASVHGSDALSELKNLATPVDRNINYLPKVGAQTRMRT